MQELWTHNFHRNFGIEHCIKATKYTRLSKTELLSKCF
jgi:hypothetical protein